MRSTLGTERLLANKLSHPTSDERVSRLSDGQRHLLVNCWWGRLAVVIWRWRHSVFRGSTVLKLRHCHPLSNSLFLLDLLVEGLFKGDPRIFDSPKLSITIEQVLMLDLLNKCTLHRVHFLDFGCLCDHRRSWRLRLMLIVGLRGCNALQWFYLPEIAVE